MTTISRVKGDESSKLYRRTPISSTSVSILPQGGEHSSFTQTMKNIEMDTSKQTKNIETRGTISDVLDEDERRSDQDACRTTLEDIDGKRDTWGGNVNLTGCEEARRSATKDHKVEIVVSEDKEVSDDEGYFLHKILPRSSHRDGSLYNKGMDSWWKREYLIADRNETRLEAKALSNPTDCRMRDGFCTVHCASQMLQIFSLEVAEIHVNGGLIELYGYIAVRDELNPLLNYVANFSRDDPITVEQGSLINIAGPKRGISLSDAVLIEFDMRIKRGENERDDLQLIDGVTIVDDTGSIFSWNHPFTIHIPGDCGAVNIILSRIPHAVEATVEILISEVQSSFSLFLDCLTSGLDKEIRLFDGAITGSCGLKRSVVAVTRNSLIDLKFKVGSASSTSDQYRCPFKAKIHGHDVHYIKTYFALISVKVTWSTLPSYFPSGPRY